MKMFANLPSRSLTALVALFLVPAFPDDAPADVPYKVYAQRLLNALPSGSAVRPDLEKYLEALVNRERRRRGRRALRSSDSVRMAARGQAAEMIHGNFVGHHTRGGFDFGDRFRTYMPRFEGLRGENAARDRQGGNSDKRKAERIFRQWLGSRGHLRNLIRADYSYFSTGVIEVGGHVYAVQLFWERPRPKSSSNFLVID